MPTQSVYHYHHHVAHSIAHDHRTILVNLGPKRTLPPKCPIRLAKHISPEAYESIKLEYSALQSQYHTDLLGLYGRITGMLGLPVVAGIGSYLLRKNETISTILAAGTFVMGFVYYAISPEGSELSRKYITKFNEACERIVGDNVLNVQLVASDDFDSDLLFYTN